MKNVDFVRFTPPESLKELLDIEEFVVFTEKSVESGYLLRCEEVGQLLPKLRKAEKNWIVGVMSSNVKVNKEAVMRKKVDLIMDSPDRRLDYATLKLAAEKDVVIELALSKFLNCWGLKRTNMLGETIQTVKLINKFNTPFVLTSGANSWNELRNITQVRQFFSFLNADGEKSKWFMQKLIRRLDDPHYIAEGLEIVTED